jgi:CDP-glycerol glycerophosphotransferase
LDFLLLDRPILFYMPDLERYRSKRGFYFDPLLLPGTITRSWASLVEALKGVLTAPRPLSSDSRGDALRPNVWGDYDGHAATGVASELRRDIDRRLARDTKDH